MSSAPLAAGGTLLRTDNLEESLARLAYVIERQRPLAVLTGPAGVGKSTCLSLLAAEVREPRRRLARISAAGMGAHSLVGSLTAELGLGRSQRPLHERLNLLLDYVQGLSAAAESAAFLLDDVDYADEECWRLLRSLVRRITQLQAAVTLIVVMAPHRIEAVLDSCRDQADFLVRLQPWSLSETAKAALAMVERHNQRIHSAGCVIDDTGLRALHECSDGNPDRLLRILELSLLACEELAEPRVTGSIIRAAGQELFPVHTPHSRLSRQPASV